MVNQAYQLCMLAQVVRATFVFADQPNTGRPLTWEGMFLEAAHYLSKLPSTDERARSFLEALGSDAPLKFAPSIPRPGLQVVR